MQMDWGLGKYEATAATLLPAAQLVVDRAALKAGERVVDVGCGTGNAALLAAAHGAVVTGVDPASRLIQVAREEAAGRGLDITFVQGEAGALPLADASADVILSVFAVIFAPDPAAAAAEMARVLAPGGRILLSAWLPEGAVNDCVGVFQGAIMEALGMTPGPPRFSWHDRAALEGLFGPLGFDVSLDTERIPFTAASAGAYLDMSQEHPLSVAGSAVLANSSDAGQAAATKALAILEAANEDPDGFRVTSRYVVATALRR